MRLAEQLPSSRVTESDLARALNMSTRTLHRKLREKNETFRSLLEQVRTDLAGRYIRNRNYNVTEIAFLLGYTDISSFSRVFKGWFGHSPTEAREHN
jgi:AraC-like DNA-binding protein